MPKVSDLNGLNAVDVDDIRDIKFLVSNLQGTPESQQVTGNEIAKFSQHIVIEQTSHGLVAGDVIILINLFKNAQIQQILVKHFI